MPIGGAPGHNEPITGQGLAIAARDVRILSDLLLSEKDWSRLDFTAYVDERRERMRRLRITAGWRQRYGLNSARMPSSAGRESVTECWNASFHRCLRQLSVR